MEHKHTSGRQENKPNDAANRKAGAQVGGGTFPISPSDLPSSVPRTSPSFIAWLSG